MKAPLFQLEHNPSSDPRQLPMTYPPTRDKGATIDISGTKFPTPGDAGPDQRSCETNPPIKLPAPTSGSSLPARAHPSHRVSSKRNWPRIREPDVGEPGAFV